MFRHTFARGSWSQDTPRIDNTFVALRWRLERNNDLIRPQLTLRLSCMMQVACPALRRPCNLLTVGVSILYFLKYCYFAFLGCTAVRAPSSVCSGGILLLLTLIIAPGAAALEYFHPNCTLPTRDAAYVSSPSVRSTLDIVWTVLATIIAWSTPFYISTCRHKTANMG